LRTTGEQRRRGSGGVTGRGFKPGQSGNPGGRPAGLAALIRAQTNDGRDIADFMLKAMRNGALEQRERMEAARWLGDRAFGRVGLTLEPLGESAAPRRIILEWGEGE